MLTVARAQRANKPPYGTPINWQNPLCRGLVADYLFNEGHGSRITDGVNGMDLFWQGAAAPVWRGVKPDLKSQGSEPTMYTAMGGVEFPGAASDIFINSDVAPFRAFDRLNVSKAVTLEAWIWNDTRASTFPTPIQLGALNTNGFILTQNTTTTYTWRIGNFGTPDANDPNASPSDPQQRWQQFVGVFDERASVFPGVAIATAVIYRDGLFRGNGTAATVWTPPTNVMRLGNTTATNNQWAGCMALVRIWDRALNPQEVAALYFDPYQIYQEVELGAMMPPSLDGRVIIDLGLSGSLQTDILLAGAIPVNVQPQGALTTDIRMAGQIPVDVSLQGDLKTAKLGRALKACGHPMFTKCERLHLGEES